MPPARPRRVGCIITNPTGIYYSFMISFKSGFHIFGPRLLSISTILGFRFLDLVCVNHEVVAKYYALRPTSLFTAYGGSPPLAGWGAQ